MRRLLGSLRRFREDRRRDPEQEARQYLEQLMEEDLRTAICASIRDSWHRGVEMRLAAEAVARERQARDYLPDVDEEPPFEPDDIISVDVSAPAAGWYAVVSRDGVEMRRIPAQAEGETITVSLTGYTIEPGDTISLEGEGGDFPLSAQIILEVPALTLEDLSPQVGTGFSSNFAAWPLTPEEYGSVVDQLRQQGLPSLSDWLQTDPPEDHGLLLEVMGEEDYEAWKAGQLIIPGRLMDRLDYRLSPDGTLWIVHEGREHGVGLCIESGEMTRGDVIAARYVLAKYDEETLWKEANLFGWTGLQGPRILEYLEGQGIEPNLYTEDDD